MDTTQGAYCLLQGFKLLIDVCDRDSAFELAKWPMHSRYASTIKLVELLRHKPDLERWDVGASMGTFG